MKSQLLTLLLLTIGAHLFQSTHQYRLQKRELTEYDLTSFIVSSCSAEKVDMFIQNLCDQTLQSALMGNFPFLTYYCKVIGSGNKYCDNLNRYTLAEQNVGAKRFLSRRSVRSYNEDKMSYRKNEDNIDTDIDLEQKLIARICLIKTDSSSSETSRFCNRTLSKIQQGQQYPALIHLCKSHPGFNYCRDVLSVSSLYSWPSSKESSSLLLSLPSNTPDNHLTSVPVEFSMSSDVESFIDQQRMNKNTNKLPLS